MHSVRAKTTALTDPEIIVRSNLVQPSSRVFRGDENETTLMRDHEVNFLKEISIKISLKIIKKY